jgi:cholesterol oxidase
MSPDKVSVWFTEEMKGFITLGQTTDYEAGFDQGQKSNTACAFHLTIKVDDVDAFVSDPNEQATATGYVDCPALGGQLPAEGIFNLLVDAGPNVKNMRYRLFFSTPDQRPLTLSGHKVVKDDGTIDIWRDTTTLFTKIFEGHVQLADEGSARVLACGILHIHPLEFAKLLSTFQSDGPSTSARNAGIEKFANLFLGTLWKIYGPKASAASTEAAAGR